MSNKDTDLEEFVVKAEKGIHAHNEDGAFYLAEKGEVIEMDPRQAENHIKRGTLFAPDTLEGKEAVKTAEAEAKAKADAAIAAAEDAEETAEDEVKAAEATADKAKTTATDAKADAKTSTASSGPKTPANAEKKGG